MGAKRFVYTLCIVEVVLFLGFFIFSGSLPFVVRFMFFFLSSVAAGGSLYRLNELYLKRKSYRCYLQAREFFQSGEPEPAEEACEQASALDPENADVENLLREIKSRKAQSLLLTGAPLESVMDFPAERHFRKAEELYGKTRFKEAKVELDKVLALNPHHGEARLLFEKTSKWETMENEKKGLEIFQAANALYDEGKLPECARLMMEARTLCGGNEAIENFHEKIFLEVGETVQRLCAQTREYLKQRQVDAAKTKLKEALCFPGDGTTSRALLLEAEKMEKALSLFEKSKTFHAQGLTEDSLENLKDSLKLCPDLTEARVFLSAIGTRKARELFSLAREYEKDNRVEEALHFLDEALFICPGITEVDAFRRVLEKKAHALKLMEKAKKVYREKRVTEACKIIRQSMKECFLDDAAAMENEMQELLHALKAVYARALEFEKTRRLKDARELYEKILERCVDYEDAYARHQTLIKVLQPREKMFLKVYFAEQERKTFCLLVKRALKIGRSADCDMVLTEQETSREHALLYYDGNRFLLEDLNSKNGTRVDGEKIKKCFLKKNHLLEFSGVKAQFGLHNGAQSSPADRTATSAADIDAGKTIAVSAPAPYFSAHLSILEGDNDMEYIVLLKEIFIGRDSLNGIVVDDPSVSKTHFCIGVLDGQFYVDDLKSLNGTYVNGRKIQERMPLMAGDVIHFESGEHRFLFADTL